jgi:hypothetical protein
MHGEIREANAIQRRERSRHWVWTVLDPESTLRLATESGPRPLAMAQRVVPQVGQVFAPGCVPRCVTDGLQEYGSAVLTHCGSWSQPERRHAPGPRPNPRWRPLPQLLEAQGGQSYRRRRLVRVKHRGVFGTIDRGTPVRSAGGWQSKTALVERRNLALRQRVAAVSRRANTLCQGEDSVGPHLGVLQSSHNLCLPPASIRLPLAAPESTQGSGAAQRWPPCPPARAAGLTDHVWTLQAVRLSRVPPWPPPAGV